jgi:protein-L-isoaspartate(D-aspartate) O-methyltransferase
LDTENARARFNMIAQQIQPWGVLDQRVLEAMGEIHREHFVPDAYRGLAYADIEVPIGDSQVMLAPKLVARMLQALTVGPRDRALVVGAGTGYLPACLGRLADRIVGLEIDPALAQAARERLAALGLYQVEIRVADGLAAPVPGAPFDAIAITGSVPELGMLAGLEAQLAPGGRLVCVVGEDPAMELMLVTRIGDSGFRRTSLLETSVPRLANCPEAQSFVF